MSSVTKKNSLKYNTILVLPCVQWHAVSGSLKNYYRDNDVKIKTITVIIM